MKLRRAVLRPYRLPLTRPLGTAHGPIVARSGWVLRVEAEDGDPGFGEACPLPEFGTEGLEDCEAALRREFGAQSTLLAEFAARLEEGSLDAARDLPICTDAPCARAAIESACVDLVARRAGHAVSTWLGQWEDDVPEELERPDGERRVAVQALVGGGTPEEVSESARSAMRLGHRAFKLKLAVNPSNRGLAADLARVAALRAVVGPSALLRLDANEAWTEAEAQQALEALAVHDVEYVEQPVDRADLDGLARLRESAPIEVAADEALLGEGLERCLEREAAGILILKPAAIGGVLTARRWAGEASRRGMRVIWSTLIDGALSRAGVRALATLGPSRNEVHGIATGALMELDFSGEPSIVDGAIAVSEIPGLGLDVDLDRESPLWTGSPLSLEIAP